MVAVLEDSEDPPRPVPVVDLDRIADTYAELKKMEVLLDPNPIEYGPMRFNHNIAKVRAMLTRVEQIFLQTSEDLHYFQRIINAKRTLYELEKRELMVNDPRCRVGRSQGEREALADVQLRAMIEGIQNLELAAHDLETVMISIKSKRTDLKNIQSRMKDQMKLLEHDMGMGAQWGTKIPPSPISAGVSEIDDMLVTVDQGLGIVETEDGDDEEEEVEETEEVVAVEEPSPEPEPVLVFGEEESVDASLPDADAQGDLPTDDQAQDEADNFLDALNVGTSDDDTQGSKEEAPDDASGIDDLISSLADD